MAHYDDVQTGKLAVLWFLGVVVTVVIVAVLVVLYYHTAADLEQKRVVDEPFVELDDTLAAQRSRLIEYRKLGQTVADGQPREVYRIPIQRAMELVVSEGAAGVAPDPSPAPGQPPSAGDGDASDDETAAPPEADAHEESAPEPGEGEEPDSPEAPSKESTTDEPAPDAVDREPPQTAPEPPTGGAEGEDDGS